MTIIAASKGHGGILFGVILIVLGVLHLTFRRFYGRRWKAVHDAREATAPEMTKPLYRRRDASWYVTAEIFGGIFMIAIGIVDVLIHL